MTEVSTAEAKRDLSHILRRVQAGERITITRYGEPVAVLHPAKHRAGSRAELRAQHGRATLDPLDELAKVRAETRF
jgi:prevent-host-death family protein